MKQCFNFLLTLRRQKPRLNNAIIKGRHHTTLSQFHQQDISLSSTLMLSPMYSVFQQDPSEEVLQANSVQNACFLILIICLALHNETYKLHSSFLYSLNATSCIITKFENLSGALISQVTDGYSDTFHDFSQLLKAITENTLK